MSEEKKESLPEEKPKTGLSPDLDPEKKSEIIFPKVVGKDDQTEEEWKGLEDKAPIIGGSYRPQPEH